MSVDENSLKFKNACLNLKYHKIQIGNDRTKKSKVL